MASEDPALPDSVAYCSGPFGQNASGPTSDSYARGDSTNDIHQMTRSDRTDEERSVAREGEREGMGYEGPYTSYRPLYGGRGYHFVDRLDCRGSNEPSRDPKFGPRYDYGRQGEDRWYGRSFGGSDCRAGRRYDNMSYRSMGEYGPYGRGTESYENRRFYDSQDYGRGRNPNTYRSYRDYRNGRYGSNASRGYSRGQIPYSHRKYGYEGGYDKGLNESGRYERNLTQTEYKKDGLGGCFGSQTYGPQCYVSRNSRNYASGGTCAWPNSMQLNRQGYSYIFPRQHDYGYPPFNPHLNPYLTSQYRGGYGRSNSSYRPYYLRGYGNSSYVRYPLDSSLRYCVERNSRMNPIAKKYGGQRIPHHGNSGHCRSSEIGRSGSHYYGKGHYFRGGLYGSYSNDRFGTSPPFAPFSKPRATHPTTLAFFDEGEDLRKIRMAREKEMAVKFTHDLQRREASDRMTDSAQNPEYDIIPFRKRLQYFPVDSIRVEFVDFLPKENSKDHRTFPYELIQRGRPSSVFRRGQTFFMDIIFQNRDFNPSRDCMFLNFYLGPNPSVPKKTRIVLPVVMQKEFQRAPQQWDIRVHSQGPGKLTLQVHIPTTAAVGCWQCIVETSFRNFTTTRLQYQSPMNIYIIFNPFFPEDSAFMENDDFRTEYIMNDNGKIFMGGFKSAKGRPWIYGQFDDCVLPAACVLLEMSKLPHSEWGNPAKVVRAISAMIKAARSGHIDAPDFGKSNGVIVPHYEEDFRGGSSPHLWTGSVQIIEEFLKGGASPVKYGQCWIMAALMTTFCRALGLASRPVTAFVAAFNNQESMTIDKYINKYGDPLDCGPGRDQSDSLWCFHTWCDVWMMRPELPVGNSGWQACDPSRSARGSHEALSSSCGPCSLEAIRKGDLGFQRDTDAFYSLLNAYTRYFYEADRSEWGFLPFMQFRFPVARYILTKAPNCLDDGGDEDFEDVTALYKDIDLPEEQRFFIYNAFRGRPRDAPEYDLSAMSSAYGSIPQPGVGEEADIKFDFQEPTRACIGEPITVSLLIHNTSESRRTIQATISCRSIFYTGVVGPRMKRATGQFTLEPGQGEMLTLRLDPVEYQEKLIDMSFMKITVTAFVRETPQSFVTEFDFRFDKPNLQIEMADECAEGKKCPFELSFRNPLGMTLSECFVTFEINGAVRPETIQIDREVYSREIFSFCHSFVPRRQGLRHLVACFTSKQLSDINGMRKILITQ